MNPTSNQTASNRWLDILKPPGPIVNNRAFHEINKNKVIHLLCSTNH